MKVQTDFRYNAWARYVLIVLLGTLSLAAAAAPRPLSQANQQASVNSPNNASEKRPSPAKVIPSRSYRSEYEAECEKGDDRRTSELCAQWKAADAAYDAAKWAKWSAVGGSLGSLLVAIALGLAFRSNWIARDTAKRQLRAYVSHVEYVMKHHTGPDGKLTGHDITAVWMNCGQTPAFDTNCLINMALQPGPLGKDFKFPPPENESLFGRLALGPGQKCNALTPMISHHQLLKLSTMQNRLFVWSQAEYQDAFGTKRRSETACEVKVIDLGHGFRIVFNSLGRHNGMDRAA